MYKALHLSSGQEIIILDVRWRQQVDYLRKLDRNDLLVCPGCMQPVRIRVGNTRRWHFAHKHLQNCPFERESPALLNARAVLYNWLVDKFDSESVTLEKRFDTLVLPRYVDCWLEKDDLTFAYWIFDRRMPPDERNSLKSAFQDMGVQVNWVFVLDLLRVDQEWMQDRLHLTTTERAFMQKSELDQAWQTHLEHHGSSLHYLNANQETLVTYRNLSVVHLPQLYAGTRLENPLEDVLVSSLTGEFIHPGEIIRLQKRRRELEQQEQKAERRLQLAREFFSRKPQIELQPSEMEKQTPKTRPLERVGTCKFCGKETADWITYFGQTKECICRECKDRPLGGDLK